MTIGRPLTTTALAPLIVTEAGHVHQNDQAGREGVVSIKRSKRAPIVRLGNCQACLSATLHQSKLAAATHPPPPSALPSLTESQRIKMHARRNRVTLLRKRLPRYSPIAALPRAARLLSFASKERKILSMCWGEGGGSGRPPRRKIQLAGRWWQVRCFRCCVGS